MLSGYWSFRLYECGTIPISVRRAFSRKTRATAAFPIRPSVSLPLATEQRLPLFQLTLLLRIARNKLPPHRRSPDEPVNQRQSQADRSPSLQPAGEQKSRCRPESRRGQPDDRANEAVGMEPLQVRPLCPILQVPSRALQPFPDDTRPDSFPKPDCTSTAT